MGTTSRLPKLLDRLDRALFAHLPLVAPALLMLALGLVLAARYWLTGR